MNKTHLVLVILVVLLCTILYAGLVFHTRGANSVILTTSVGSVFCAPFVINPKACEITTTLSSPSCNVCGESIEVSTKPTSNVVVIVDFIGTKVSTTVYHKECLIDDCLQEEGQQGEYAHEYKKSHSSSL